MNTELNETHPPNKEIKLFSFQYHLSLDLFMSYEPIIMTETSKSIKFHENSSIGNSAQLA
jgi:hypothetical protein